MRPFSKPTAFLAALKELLARKLVPTAMSTADLQEVDAEIRRKALFSARLTQAEPLQELQEGLADMLSGEGNLADAKLRLTKVYEKMGYQPEAGFKQDAPGTVPPARPGGLTDLSSDKRMTLTITTNYRIAANTAYVTAGNTDVRRYQFPAWELIRIARRRVPRGQKLSRKKGVATLKPKPGDDWQSRWLAAGGELFDKRTRMIAAKDSPVWQKLGDGAGGFKDTLGNPFPPFAFGSGYGIREVQREECLLLGVIAPDDRIAKASPSLEASIKAEAARFDPQILAAMGKDLAVREDGTVRLKRLREESIAKAKAEYEARKLGSLHNSGTRVGALLGWITRRRGRQQALRAYDAVMHPKKSQRRRLAHAIIYKRVDAAEAARIRQGAGLDVAGAHHALDVSSVGHIHRRHGNAKTEALHGQIAVTRDDFARLHQIHSDPKTRITRSAKDHKQSPVIEYVWTHREKEYHLAERYQQHRHTLIPVSLYIRRVPASSKAQDKLLRNRLEWLVSTAMDAPSVRRSPSKTSETCRGTPNATPLRARCKTLLTLLQAGRAAA